MTVYVLEKHARGYGNNTITSLYGVFKNKEAAYLKAENHFKQILNKESKRDGIFVNEKNSNDVWFSICSEEVNEE